MTIEELREYGSPEGLAGDLGNAKYWYARCGRPYPGQIPFDAEVSAILAQLSE
jgi:hypothetical protein